MLLADPKSMLRFRRTNLRFCDAFRWGLKRARVEEVIGDRRRVVEGVERGKERLQEQLRRPGGCYRCPRPSSTRSSKYR